MVSGFFFFRLELKLEVEFIHLFRNLMHWALQERHTLDAQMEQDLPFEWFRGPKVCNSSFL